MLTNSPVSYNLPQSGRAGGRHSTVARTIDQKGHVRGVYDFKDAAYLKQLLADARTLLSEGGTPP